MLSNSSHTLVVPSGAACFVGSPQAGDLTSSPCPVTSDMLQFLNLTLDFGDYFHAYCLNPPQGDGCPYGYCPNPEIAGLFVRIAAYLTNFFVTVLVFYQPDGIKETFWAQLLSMYSLLLTCAATLFLQQLTRFHAILAVATAGSPLTVCIFLYALRSIWESDHRLSKAVGPKIPRSIVLVAMVFWIGLFIYITLPSHLSHFQQESCEANNHAVKYFFALPLLIFIDMPVWAQCLGALPFLLTMLAWIVAILLRRREIWPEGEPYKPHFRSVWRTIKKHYPFIQFVTVIVIPLAYWVAAIETAVIAAKTNDNHSAATFGQVLAMFVAVPPGLEVIELTPRVLNWFLDLSWVRFITRRPRRVPDEPEPTISFTFPSESGDSGFNHHEKNNIIPLVISRQRNDSMPSESPLGV